MLTIWQNSHFVKKKNREKSNFTGGSQLFRGVWRAALLAFLRSI